MNIILGEENARALKEKYLVLELDRFWLSDSQFPVQSYAVVEISSIQDIFRIEELSDLHRNLIRFYREKNWKFCEDALEHLMGQWAGQLDSFYEHLKSRIEQGKESSENWSDIIVKK